MFVLVYGTLTDPARARAVLNQGTSSRDASSRDTSSRDASSRDTSSRDTSNQGTSKRERAESNTTASVAGRVDSTTDVTVASATLDGLHRVDGQYPTLAPGGRVDGRLLVVDDVGLARLDRYEGVDRGLYVRVPVPLTGTEAIADADVDGSPTAGVAETAEAAWTYVGEPERLDVSADVDWPRSETFASRVRRYVEDHPITVAVDGPVDGRHRR